MASRGYFKKIFDKMRFYADDIVDMGSERKTNEPSSPLKMGTSSPGKSPMPNFRHEMRKKLRILDKLSWLSSLIAFHQKDLSNIILDLNLLDFILILCEPEFPSKIRSNAMLAISLVTYNNDLFSKIIEIGVIDKVLALCMDPYVD